MSARGIPVTLERGTSLEQPLPPLRNWPQQALELLTLEDALVRVVIADVRGSAPREAGASMLVSSARMIGTIGGGNLEWQALQAAHALLQSQAGGRTVRLVLGTELGQCCGGVVTIWLNRFSTDDLPLLRAVHKAQRSRHAQRLESRLDDGRIHYTLRPAAAQEAAFAFDDAAQTLTETPGPAHPPLWVFGAGHVGQALVRIVVDLPFAITWIDSRAGLFPADLPDSLSVLALVDPVAAVARAPRQTRFLVLTHSHQLDYELCRAILERNDFASLGLIGSTSKAARFRSRLFRDGITPQTLSRLNCPVGAGDATSKWPAAIAVSIAAQLLQGNAAKRAGLALRRPHHEASCGLNNCAECGQAPRPVSASKNNHEKNL